MEKEYEKVLPEKGDGERGRTQWTSEENNLFRTANVSIEIRCNWRGVLTLTSPQV